MNRMGNRDCLQVAMHPDEAAKVRNLAAADRTSISYTLNRLLREGLAREVAKRERAERRRAVSADRQAEKAGQTELDLGTAA